MNYIIKFPNDAADAYFVRYSPIRGPVYTFVPSEARRFPSREFAQNVINGDERLRNGVIEESYNAASI